MPIQAPQWTDYLNCPVCCREFGAPPRSPVSLGCGHTICRHCLKHLHRQQCPFDKIVIQVDVEDLVVNTAILQLAGYPPPAQPYHPPCIQALPEPDRHAFDIVVKCFEQLALYLKNCATNNNVSGSRLSRPMQRKVVTLLQCAITDEEGRGKAARAARSLGERTVTELILQHQNPQQLSANLWAAVRARGCQFLGPVMQEEVLKLVLLALEDGSALSRKVLVMFVVQRLEPHFPQASKTSIGHVVQLLYRASCFKVSKRESDSSLMQLKEEFRTYEALRREHDAQIVQIANEAGLRIAPDQWSALLYGATAQKSHMQSIIDKLQTPQSFYQSVQELFIAQQRTGDTAHLVGMSVHLDRLANIDPSADAASPTWQQLAEILTSLREVVSSLVLNIQQHASARDNNHTTHLDRNTDTNSQMAVTPTHGRYKVMCRDSATRAYCPRGAACNFAHTDDEERYGTASNPTNVNGNFNNYIMPMGTIPHVQLPPIYPGYPMQQSIDNYNLPSMAPIQVGALQPEMNKEFETAHVENLQTPPSFPTPMRAPQPGINGVMSTPMRFMPRYNNERVRYPQPGYDGLPPRPTQPFVTGPPPPMPNIYVVQQDMGNMATFGITNNAADRRHDIIPSVNVSVPYTPTPIEAHPDPVWPPINNNVFRFEELSNSLPALPPANDDNVKFPKCQVREIEDDRNKMFNVSPSRRGLTGERPLNAADRLADDQELEQELQALERRIDTEFKNTD